MLKKLLCTVVGVLISSVAFAAININTATAEELASLPGIGPGKAQAIIDFRKAHGGFKTLDELKEVKGIGDKTFEKLRPELSLTGESKPVVAAPRKAAPSASTKTPDKK
ncbi:MAG: helix-hairpin-helix domain-containing protein [Candidatus Dactylopiibacterium sp.]|nr:helix-hairpin-helix domain-containing protein [Candidatus Dactylopiibacterium sp.]